MSETTELLLTLLAVGAPIFVIVFIVQFFKYRTELVKRELKRKSELDGEAMAQMRATIASLTERMKTVEKIITDGKYDLGREIDDLK